MRTRMSISHGFHMVSVGTRRRDPLASLEELLAGSEGDDALDIVDISERLTDPTETSPAENAERMEASLLDMQLADMAMKMLPPPLRAIMQKVYIENASFADIEKEFPTLKGRVRRMHALACKTMIENFTTIQKEVEGRVIDFPEIA